MESLIVLLFLMSAVFLFLAVWMFAVTMAFLRAGTRAFGKYTDGPPPSPGARTTEPPRYNP